jgi:beta-glucosidase/6-phospho-beta-glucosidase/beta-galactosidase
MQPIGASEPTVIPRSPTLHGHRAAPRREESPVQFRFTTGIENSYPTIAGGRRIDQMEKCGHYARWADDFGLVHELGLRTLRWGPAYYRTHTAPDRYDWSSADEPMHRLHDLGIEVVADLCHFGVPDWLGGFQDPAFPVLFAEYARAFARRYPWVRFYTPVNEIFVCASFSALRGWWNEQEKSDAAFVRAMRNLCMANELAIEAILGERPDAIFVQAESFEHFHAANRAAEGMAARWNARKFLSLDLTTGHPLAPGTAAYLHDHGVTSNELAFFRERRAVGQRWIGIDYYATCEHTIDADGHGSPARTPLGLRRVGGAYHARYGLPLFHCETNTTDGPATDWLAHQWNDVIGMRADGVPVVGFTWFSLTDQIDWQHALRHERNDLHTVGLYDLDRRERSVGHAFRQLVAANRDLPAWHQPEHVATSRMA